MVTAASAAKQLKNVVAPLTLAACYVTAWTAVADRAVATDVAAKRPNCSKEFKSSWVLGCWRNGSRDNAPLAVAQVSVMLGLDDPSTMWDKVEIRKQRLQHRLTERWGHDWWEQMFLILPLFLQHRCGFKVG